MCTFVWKCDTVTLMKLHLNLKHKYMTRFGRVGGWGPTFQLPTEDNRELTRGWSQARVGLEIKSRWKCTQLEQIWMVGLTWRNSWTAPEHPSAALWHIYLCSTYTRLRKGQMSDFGLSSLRLTMPKFAEAGNAVPATCLLITQSGEALEEKCSLCFLTLYFANGCICRQLCIL